MSLFLLVMKKIVTMSKQFNWEPVTFLYKPFRLADMLNSVKNILEKRYMKS